jgi:hypothetical protein
MTSPMVAAMLEVFFVFESLQTAVKSQGKTITYSAVILDLVSVD